MNDQIVEFPMSLRCTKSHVTAVLASSMNGFHLADESFRDGVRPKWHECGLEEIATTVQP